MGWMGLRGAGPLADDPTELVVESAAISPLGPEISRVRRWWARELTSSYSQLLGAVCAVGLLIRVLYVVFVSSGRPRGFDQAFYRLSANLLAHGLGYIYPWDYIRAHEVHPTAFFPPGYPLFLALVDLLGLTSRLSQLLASSLLGVGSIAMVGLLGRRVVGPAVGIVAATCAAFYPMFFGAEGALMSEALYLPLVLIALLLTYRLCRAPTRTGFLCLGVVIALAALTRSDGALLFPLLVIPLLFVHRRLRWRRRMALGLSAFVGFLAFVSPWLIRNALTFHQPLWSNSTSTVIAGANCPASYYGRYLGSWDQGCLIKQRPDHPDLSETALNNENLRTGLSYAEHHLLQLPVVVVVRVLRTWGLYHPLGQMRWEAIEGRVWPVQVIGWAMFLVLVPFALYGLWSARHRGCTVWPLLSMVVMVVLTSAVAHGNQRFRIAAEPGILVLASVGLIATGAWLWRQAGPRVDRWKRSGGAPPNPIPAPNT